MLLERILLERQPLWRISFRVNELRKFKDGGAHGRTEAERYHSLSESTGVELDNVLSSVKVTNTVIFPSHNVIR